MVWSAVRLCLLLTSLRYKTDLLLAKTYGNILEKKNFNKNFKTAQTQLFLHQFEESQVSLERKLPEDFENGTGCSFLLRLG